VKNNTTRRRNLNSHSDSRLKHLWVEVAKKGLVCGKYYVNTLTSFAATTSYSVSLVKMRISAAPKIRFLHAKAAAPFL
jgi:hypothetical protein